jgi:hypothetical protein
MGRPVEFPKATLASMGFLWWEGVPASSVTQYPTHIPAVQTQRGHTSSIQTSSRESVTFGQGSGDQSWLQYKIFVKNKSGIVTCWEMRASVRLPLPTTNPRWWR